MLPPKQIIKEPQPDFDCRALYKSVNGFHTRRRWHGKFPGDKTKYRNSPEAFSNY